MESAPRRSILESNLTRRVDFALFMVEALQNDELPGLVLFVVVGGSFLAAGIAVLARLRVARTAAFAAGAIVLGWLAVETAIIGYVSWMLPATTLGGLLVLLLAWLQPPQP